MLFFVPKKIMDRMNAKGDGIANTAKSKTSTNYNLLGAQKSGVFYNVGAAATATETTFVASQGHNPY